MGDKNAEKQFIVEFIDVYRGLPALWDVKCKDYNLQKELYEARSYHINLHVEYTQLKNAYERQVNVTDDEWRAVEKFGLVEPVNRVISKFWEDIEFITTAFFDILDLLNRKDYLEKSILTIWKSQLVQVKDKETHEEVVPTSEEGIAVVPGYLEYLNSQLAELKGRIKWVEFNLMKYKFAASHGPELKSTINQVLKGSKKHSKWPKIPRSWRHPNRKLEGEVEWYRKRLKFFREDVQRIKSVHQAIFQKCLTPEDQKRFPSKTITLENRLKGNPSNYPGSWIETSRHSGLSTNLSGHSSTSGNTVLPWTISVAGPSRLESSSAIAASQQTHAENREQRHETKVEADGVSEKVKDRMVNEMTDYNSSNPKMEGKFAIEAHCSRSRESPDDKLSTKTGYSDQNKIGMPDVAPSVSHYGDGERKCTSKSSVTTFSVMEKDTQQFIVQASKMEVVNRIMDDRNPFLKDEASKTERSTSTTNSSGSTNPFEEDEDVETDSNDIPSAASTVGSIKASSKSVDEKDSSKQGSSESSYESAEEILSAPVDGPSKIVAQEEVPLSSPSNRISQCTSLTRLASSIYVPCSLPLYDCSTAGMRHVNAYTSTSNVPEIVNNYELLFLQETQKPQRNVLKKLFGKKK